ncbi:MAG: tetratricopeptide repeat protein [Phycisphaerae bacterium]|nr:tetratricopeptide repeat protein [Phycisphaerae bacterium]
MTSAKRRLILVALLLATPAIAADDKPFRIEWAAKDTAGNDVKVPAAGKPTVLLFAMAGQPQSQQAIAQAKTVLGAEPAAQVVLVLSGDQPEAAADKLAKDKTWPWAIVVDKDFAASGKMLVRVWPTTLVAAADGEQLAHIAGLAPAYAKIFGAYLSFAGGKINKEQLEQLLASHQVVTDSPAQMAARHLEIAQRLAAKGLLDQARAELDKGLKLDPNNAGLNVTKVHLLLIGGQPDQAQAWLEKLDPESVPAWQMSMLRGRVLMAQDKWEQARVVLTGAVRLKPQPAEAYYCLGLVHERLGDWRAAADAYRRAFEATPVGREVTGPAGRSIVPASQPAGRSGQGAS